MAEPKETSAVSKALKEQKKGVEKILKQGSGIPAQMIAQSNNQKAAFLKLKFEIDSKLAVVHEGLYLVKQMVKANFRCKENPDGLLTRKDSEYMVCLKLENLRLEQLLRQDEAYWAMNHEFVKRQAGEIQDQMKQFLERQQKDFEEMLNRSMRGLNHFALMSNDPVNAVRFPPPP